MVGGQIYLGFADPGGKGPDGKAPGIDKGGDKGGTVTRAMFNRLEKCTPNTTEAEVIAIVGWPPKRLGPQQIAPGLNSTDTLQWSNGRSTITVWIVNGKYGGVMWDGPI
jgi:hypothetical protein